MIWVHAGLPKTGSTALQANLASLTRREAGSELKYIGRLSKANNLGLMNEDFEANDHGFNPSSRRNHRRLIWICKKYDHVVLSHEHFLGHPGHPSLEFMYANLESRLDNLRATLAPVANFRLVVYIRAQYDWVESLYNEHIKWGPVSPQEAETFAQSALRAVNFSYRRLIEKLLRGIGPERLSVRVFQSGKPVTNDFLSILNLQELAPVSREEWNNVSIPPQEIALLNLLRKRAPNLQFAINDFIQRRPWRDHAREFSAFSTARQKQLIDFTLDDLRSIQTDFAGSGLIEEESLASVIERTSQANPRPDLQSLTPGEIREAYDEVFEFLIPLAQTSPRAKRLRAQAQLRDLRSRVTR